METVAKPKVYISKQIPAQVLSYLEEYCECKMWDGSGGASRQGLLAELQDVEGLLTTGGPIDAELLQHAPKLRAVSSISVGYNHFDLDAMRTRGVLGMHTPYVLDDTVADLVLALMLASARRVPELDAFVKEGKWQRGRGLKEEDFFGMDVHHATIGILGMGRIGEAIAKRAVHGFDMELLYYNRTRKPEAEERFGAQYVTTEELLRRSDFVVLMTPLTAETKMYFRKEHFELMKPTAFFINASRGQTVDEAALIEALRSGRIRGAGLDVFDPEPPQPDNPLLSMPNVVTLPHIGSATEKTRFDMAMLAARNLVAALTGGRPPHVVKELADLVESR
ncbi:D-isomer specific 2-hydroxyacid dehydrogenase NAD-binding protein [Paenibacillus mucilaginosus KNP414]|uniref:Glyoxylate/hydroxypyruvate reductase B n=1 Tax=Paenibacillus mucilaginosus (strain KNP414) TaxID=1036673 RepID=F8F8I4_PAEMK|nr:D-isomer specific 2-hydroxyacid dehydrogenase NAD-binding protein [Paenibacillus mucilaginosus KNP414]